MSKVKQFIKSFSKNLLKRNHKTSTVGENSRILSEEQYKQFITYKLFYHDHIHTVNEYKKNMLDIPAVEDFIVQKRLTSICQDELIQYREQIQEAEISLKGLKEELSNNLDACKEV